MCQYPPHTGHITLHVLAPMWYRIEFNVSQLSKPMLPHQWQQRVYQQGLPIITSSNLIPILWRITINHSLLGKIACRQPTIFVESGLFLIKPPSNSSCLICEVDFRVILFALVINAYFHKNSPFPWNTLTILNLPRQFLRHAIYQGNPYARA